MSAQRTGEWADSHSWCLVSKLASQELAKPFAVREAGTCASIISLQRSCSRSYSSRRDFLRRRARCNRSPPRYAPASREILGRDFRACCAEAGLAPFPVHHSQPDTRGRRAPVEVETTLFLSDEIALRTADAANPTLLFGNCCGFSNDSCFTSLASQILVVDPTIRFLETCPQ